MSRTSFPLEYRCFFFFFGVSNASSESEAEENSSELLLTLLAWCFVFLDLCPLLSELSSDSSVSEHLSVSELLTLILQLFLPFFGLIS